MRIGQLADVVDGPEEVESLALYNGVRMVALEVVKNQGDNTIEVVDGLSKAAQTLQRELPRGMSAEVVRDNSRPIRPSVANLPRTPVDEALVHTPRAFLFLNTMR